MQILLGTWPLVGKIALRELPASGLVMMRTLGAALIFLLLKNKFALAPIRTRSDYWRLACYSLLGISLNQLLFVKGLSYTTAINTTVLATTIPVFATLVSVALRRELASWSKITGVALAAFGTLYLVNPLHTEFSRTTLLGDFLIVCNCVCYGAYIALSQNLLRRYGTFTVVFWIFLFGSLSTIPFGAYSLTQVNWGALSGSIPFTLLYIIVAPTVVAYFLNAWALARVAPSVVAAYIYLQPLIAFVTAPLILGEKLEPQTGLAALIIFTGVGVVTQSARKKFRQDEPDEPD